jgi:hypothetical protein|tara:strand:+ start:1485 stop:1715 length:231 start_codon:yes stop_codon:yes gene_type:complete
MDLEDQVLDAIKRYAVMYGARAYGGDTMDFAREVNLSCWRYLSEWVLNKTHRKNLYREYQAYKEDVLKELHGYLDE